MQNGLDCYLGKQDSLENLINPMFSVKIFLEKRS